MAEVYRGVKFKTEFASRRAPENLHNKKFLEWCHKFAEGGFAPLHKPFASKSLLVEQSSTRPRDQGKPLFPVATRSNASPGTAVSQGGKNNVAPQPGKRSSGNASFRTKFGFIITRTASNLANVELHDLVEVTTINFDTFWLKAIGIFLPSSESMTHGFIYRERPDVKVIFHGHDDEILKNAAKLGLAITEKEAPYGSKTEIAQIKKTLGKNNFLVLKGHGFLSLGKSVDDAGKIALKIKNKAAAK